MTADRPERQRRWPWICGFAYALCLGGVVWSMFAARDWALAEMSSDESVAEWETWREEVLDEQTNPSPVQRRVPQSTEPPALVLMRDHFGVSLAGAVLFSTLLYWVIAWFVLGTLTMPIQTTSDHQAS